MRKKWKQHTRPSVICKSFEEIVKPIIICIACICRPIENKFLAEVYDIDTETESDNENQTKVDLGTKEGYLLKGPEIGSDRIFSNLASKSFKKRYCSMVRGADGTYILEVYKDEKKTDTKLTIVMDFCSDVVKVSKKLLCAHSRTLIRVRAKSWCLEFVAVEDYYDYADAKTALNNFLTCF